VCIPEAMAISETIRLIADLEDFKIKARQIIVNHVNVSEDCVFCKRRKAGQAKYIQQINEIYSELNRVEIPEFAEEIQGLEPLKNLRKYLFEN
jgi:arsenite-transporting ATPase